MLKYDPFEAKYETLNFGVALPRMPMADKQEGTSSKREGLIESSQSSDSDVDIINVSLREMELGSFNMYYWKLWICITWKKIIFKFITWLIAMNKSESIMWWPKQRKAH